jgi:hypothetical protein
MPAVLLHYSLIHFHGEPTILRDFFMGVAVDEFEIVPSFSYTSKLLLMYDRRVNQMNDACMTTNQVNKR